LGSGRRFASRREPSSTCAVARREERSSFLDPSSGLSGRRRLYPMPRFYCRHL
jgi:hypothetical protein